MRRVTCIGCPSRDTPDFGAEPEQEFSLSHEGVELRCFSTSALHDPQWAVTVANGTFGTRVPD
ncbi:MAG TPA: hypothetical protein VHJ82_07050, partial [Actinomycetota bacterium]|nr:hypothetical protein [Actinomycetota bacterium]